MSIRWDSLKSEWLKQTRGVSFEELVSSRFIGITEHPKRPHQWLMLFELNGYIWVAPYVRDGEDRFLKTAFPSRMYTKKWIRGELQ